MDQLIYASISHTHYWFEVGMLKVPANRDMIPAELALALFYSYRKQNEIRPVEIPAPALYSTLVPRFSLYSIIKNSLLSLEFTLGPKRVNHRYVLSYPTYPSEARFGDTPCLLNTWCGGSQP